MKFKISLILLLVFFLLLFSWVNLAFGFGISPPRVFNDHLIPGAHFEQTITLTQARPETPLKIEVIIDAPEIEDWIEIKPGKSFIIPAGVQQFPMKVSVSVPKDAGYATYQGKLTIRAIPAEGGEGQIAVVTGAVADIQLRVSGEEFSDFRLKGVDTPNIEEGDPIKVVMKLENLGNVKVRPSRVYLRIFDQYGQGVVEEGEATGMNWIEPFKTGKVIAKMPNKLSIGEYWAEIEIYKDGELVLLDKRKFHVVEKGALGKIFGLYWWCWVLVAGVILAGILTWKLKLWGKALAKLGIRIKVEKIKK